MSEMHAFEARRALLQTVSRGEARVNLAEAALQIAAEDDALVSHTVVQLPVASFRQRLEKLAQAAARGPLAQLPASSSPEQQIEVVEQFLWQQQRFRLPTYGRSNVPAASVVDHPGVWEDARHAYLHEVLIRRVGCSAALAVIFADVMQRLLAMGAVNFVVRIDCSNLDVLPTAEAMPNITRELAVTVEGILNTCSQDVLLELLRFLKRSYWPFSWDSSGGPNSSGGFKDAALEALHGAASAELQAIATVAAHRLQRGIWTSPGAGDLRRALTAAERSATIFGDSHPTERRDAAVLLLHAGSDAQARTELRAYAATDAAKQAPLQQRELVAQLLQKLDATPGIDDGPLPLPLRVQTSLGAPPPQLSADRRVALTW